MALKISPPKKDAGIEYDHLHLRNASNGAPETNASPFGVKGRFRAYRKNGGDKSFVAVDKVPLLEIDVSDLEALAVKWATAGRLEDAEKVAIAMRAYEEVLALIIEDQHPGLTVEVE